MSEKIIMNEFLKHYQIGCWFYRTTTYQLDYDPIDAMKDLGMTFATLPEHWHYGKTGLEEKNLDKYMQSARRNQLPVLYTDRRMMGTRPIAKPSLEKARERLEWVKKEYGDILGGIYVCDEPWWGIQDEHKAIDTVAEYTKLSREILPDCWTFIALLGGPKARWKIDFACVCDYIESVKPDFLLYNVYSQLLAEENEKEQGVINFFYQLNLYVEAAKKYNIPLWASPMCSACWSFRQPAQVDFRWQLNVLAAHGVTGFVWYHLQENATNVAKNGMCPINSFDEKTVMYDWMRYENRAFMKCIASKLDGYKLEEVYHFYQRFANFKALEFEDDEIIEDVKSQYNRPLVISRFKATDGSGKQRVMVTNLSRTENGHCEIKFKGEYAKYNKGSYSMYMQPASALIIDLFDTPEDPRDIVLD